MGLPTGVELKTAEPVKSEEAVAATTVEELRPAVTPIEMTAATTGTANADSTDAAEVQRPPPVCQLETITCMKSAPLNALISHFLSGCSPAGTNPHETRQKPCDGVEREAPRPEVRTHLWDRRQPRQALRHGGGNRRAEVPGDRIQQESGQGLRCPGCFRATLPWGLRGWGC